MNEQNPAPVHVDDDGRGSPSLHAVVGRVLQAGMWSSVVLVAAGSLRSALSGGFGTDVAATQRLVSAPPAPLRLGTLVEGLARGNGTSLAMAGLLLLVATPVLRVAASTAVFALRRDRAYVAICSVVLALMILGFLLGRAG